MLLKCNDNYSRLCSKVALTKEIKGRSKADRQKASDIAEEVGHAIGVTRNLSRGLHPITLTRQGLPAALEELAARVPKDVEFNWPISKRLDLETSVALHIYRIAEEAVVIDKGKVVHHQDTAGLARNEDIRRRYLAM